MTIATADLAEDDWAARFALDTVERLDSESVRSAVDIALDAPRVGDVGFTDRGGRFVRLFNTLQPAGHVLNLLGVPQGYEPLDIDSRLVVRSGAMVEEGMHSASNSSTSSQPPCVLCEHLQPNAAVSSYLVRHWDAWQRFARTLGLGRADVFFVSGVTHRTASTGVAVVTPAVSSPPSPPSPPPGGKRPMRDVTTASATSRTQAEDDVVVVRTKVLAREGTSKAVHLPCTRRDPLDVVLQYILETSDARAAIASDSTLPALLAASHSGSAHAQTAPAALLRALRPRVRVHPSGAGQLAHEWAARTFVHV